LLGLRENITTNGQIEFVKSSSEENSILDVNVLIIDEVSMLDDKLFTEIYNYYRKEVKIILMGDPAQIPPVAKDNCIPFRKDLALRYNFREAVIKQIMRQANGNPILEASLKLRQNITDPVPLPDLKTSVNGEGNGIIVVNLKDPNIKDQTRSLLQQYFHCPLFKNNADYAKVIAWRNKTVDYFNKMIREIIFGTDAPAIMPGEKLVVGKPVMKESDHRTVIALTTSEELEVCDVQLTTKRVDGKSYPVYSCVVEYVSIGGGLKRERIDILRDEGTTLYQAQLAELKRNAIAAQGKNSTWHRYYDFMRQFAEVSYNYAITAHRAQGSTYGNVFLIEDDIDHNSKIVERNRIKYTS
ncbi:MAG TPA: AAA family ATPase, partial [Allocoleopsis sp.]